MISLLFMLAIANGPTWKVHFDVNVENTAIIAITECKGEIPFYAFDRQPLRGDGEDVALIRRQLTPKGARCTVQFNVMRAPDDDPNHEYIGDSIIIIQED